ncbi:unnamed protein product [Schistocephalus solidus]|uniref:LysR_substrate domain-containing protein n=1 Tax=Schistocephalus solidus TaxID=70667 RepID=A0A183STB5_SCHSO|nr:unnamed protein product [Schistocephalus solidus]
MVRKLHNGIMAVTDKGAVPEELALTDRVTQGRILTANPFGLMHFSMLVDAYRDDYPEIFITSRTNGTLLNSRCMQASARISRTSIRDLLFADDCAPRTASEGHMQRNMDPFAAGCAKFSLTTQSEKQPTAAENVASRLRTGIRFSEQVHLQNVAVGYSSFWSGCPNAERRDAAVAFVIQNDIMGRLPCLSALFASVPKANKLFFLDDFNTRFGID